MLIQLTPDEILSFWRRVDQTDEWGCWPWMGHRMPFGHGQLTIRNLRTTAHRLAYILVYGPLPSDKPIASHVCNNPPCCNPMHIRPDTQRGNLLYMQACGRKAQGDRHWMRLHPEKVARGDTHYSRVHPELVLRGEGHGSARITETAVIAIRALWQAGNLTQGQIADQFGIDQTHVSLIVRYKSWSHVP